MALEDRRKQHDGQVVDKYGAPNANYQMTTRDYVMRPSADPVSGPITITLPPVSEAKGRFYSIICRNADPVNTVTVADNDDSECWDGDFVMDGKCDKLLAYSDGLAWLVARNFDVHATTNPPGTTEPPTTAAPTTLATTANPTTAGQATTAAATTAGAQTTAAPTTVGAQTTAAPTTAAPTTAI